MIFWPEIILADDWDEIEINYQKYSAAYDIKRGLKIIQISKNKSIKSFKI